MKKKSIFPKPRNHPDFVPESHASIFRPVTHRSYNNMFSVLITLNPQTTMAIRFEIVFCLLFLCFIIIYFEWNEKNVCALSAFFVTISLLPCTCISTTWLYEISPKIVILLLGGRGFIECCWILLLSFVQSKSHVVVVDKNINGSYCRLRVTTQSGRDHTKLLQHQWLDIYIFALFRGFTRSSFFVFFIHLQSTRGLFMTGEKNSRQFNDT